MVSMGVIKSSFETLVRIMLPNISTKHTISVVKRPNNAYILVRYLRSYMAIKLFPFFS